MNTPYPKESLTDIKNAYLFSCFCGLRISDIIKLKWNDVFVDRGQYRLAVSMKKTKEPIYLPLSPEALKWMPERGGKSSEDNVFDLSELQEFSRNRKELLDFEEAVLSERVYRYSLESGDINFI